MTSEGSIENISLSRKSNNYYSIEISKSQTMPSPATIDIVLGNCIINADDISNYLSFIKLRFRINLTLVGLQQTSVYS